MLELLEMFVPTLLSSPYPVNFDLYVLLAFVQENANDVALRIVEAQALQLRPTGRQAHVQTFVMEFVVIKLKALALCLIIEA